MTSQENMAKIILEAGQSNYGIYWEQLPDWAQAIDIIRNSPMPWSEYDDMIVYGVFGDILHAMELEDTGFESYSQLQEVLLAR
jgi:hypothetical protein